MPHIVFLTASGRQITVETQAGTSVMQAAIAHGIAEMHAECGGSCSCATCHVYVEAPWTSATGPAGDMEDGMLDGTYETREPHSRLACQITMTLELDGLVVRLPGRQV